MNDDFDIDDPLDGPSDSAAPLSDRQHRELVTMLRHGSIPPEEDRREEHLSAALAVYDEITADGGTVHHLHDARSRRSPLPATARMTRLRVLASAAAIVAVLAGGVTLMTRTGDDGDADGRDAVAAGAPTPSDLGDRAEQRSESAGAPEPDASRPTVGAAQETGPVTNSAEAIPPPAATADRAFGAAPDGDAPTTLAPAMTTPVPDLGRFSDDAALADAWSDLEATRSAESPGTTPAAVTDTAAPECPLPATVILRASGVVAGLPVWIVTDAVTDTTSILDLSSCRRRPL